MDYDLKFINFFDFRIVSVNALFDIFKLQIKEPVI